MYFSNTKSAQSSGFTLLEMAIVLVIVSSLIAVGLPMMKTQIERHKYNTDLNYLKDVSNALMGYAASRGGLSHYGEDSAAQTIPNTIAHTTLGLNSVNSYQKLLHYDSNDSIRFVNSTDANIGRNLLDFCTLLQTKLNAIGEAPQICRSANGCDITNPNDLLSVAYVLISPGKNYKLDDPNTDADRIYASPNKSYDASYEDSVTAVSFDDLYSTLNCATRLNPGGGGGGSDVEGGGLDCGSNLPITISNIHPSNLLIARISGTDCFSIPPGYNINVCPHGGSQTKNVRFYNNNNCSGNNALYHLSESSDT
ncbi:MAG: type II secretion system GspH family protein, partial [Gammaproteobacteria bacterium]|nr:type II secretion system GspH family protein [Gammaproteobacteria bacterium]